MKRKAGIEFAFNEKRVKKNVKGPRRGIYFLYILHPVVF
jgi:hypothetical protein